MQFSVVVYIVTFIQKKTKKNVTTFLVSLVFSNNKY